MAELKPLNALFNQALYRIPDYQRGYAWTKDQLDDLWSDLANISPEGHHYTGVITLKEIRQVEEAANEYWLVRSGFKLYHVIDGQQRLTSCMVLIQCILDEIRSFHRKKKPNATDDAIIFADRKLQYYVDLYLYQDKSNGVIRTHKFGYDKDNPSERYYRHCILNEPHGGAIEQSFYTLNLQNAMTYFRAQVKELLSQGESAVEDLFRKLTVGLLFNEYIIPAEFDEFVAFETMNNRGKKLSNLELLKNRLIYLSTLYTPEEADQAMKKEIRDEVNRAWRMVYHELGRNSVHPLNDDDFLRGHWILYYMYSRKSGEDFKNFLLKQNFTSRRIHKKVPAKVELAEVSEYSEIDEEGEEMLSEEVATRAPEQAELQPKEVLDYVRDLSATSHAWFRSWFPHFDHQLNDEVAEWVDRLGRLPMSYGRPMVTAILMRPDFSNDDRVSCLKAMERTFFIQFRLAGARSNYGSSEFYNLARSVHRRKAGVDEIIKLSEKLTKYAFDQQGNFKHDYFRQEIQKRFSSNSSLGFYGWPGLDYFLYEYEEHLRGRREERKLDWHELTRRQEKQHVSIEHILPQTPSEPYWRQRVGHLGPTALNILTHSLGNLLPLSRSINASYQNDGFDEKVVPRRKNGQKVRTGYREGCYSEIEVGQFADWTHVEIIDRGLRMLNGHL